MSVTKDPRSSKPRQKMNMHRSCRKLKLLLRERFPARGLLVALEHRRTPSSRANAIPYAETVAREMSDDALTDLLELAIRLLQERKSKP